VSLLFNEPPIAVSPTLARELGLNAAAFLQQLHYWAEEKRRNPDRYRDSWQSGYFWVYNTIDEWLGQMPFLGSKSTFKRMLSELQSQGVLVVENFNKRGNDHTGWYRINYLRLDQIAQSVNRSAGQNEPPASSKWTAEEVKMSRSAGQNEPSITRDFSETSTETTNTPFNPPSGEVPETRKKSSASSRSKKERLFNEDGVPLPKHDPAGFLRWVQAHPKQSHFASAANEWDALKPNRPMVERLILNVTERTRKDADWVKEGGKYIPNPAAYLKGCRWLDKYTEVSVSGGPHGVTVSYQQRAPGQTQSDEEYRANVEASRKRWEAKQAAQQNQNFSEYEGVTLDVAAI